MDGGAWWAAVHGVTKSWTRLSDFTFTFHFHALEKEMATHSRVLAWRIPGMGEPGGLPSIGSHRVGHDWSDLAATLCGVSRPRIWWGHNFKEELFPVAVALMLEVNSLTPGCAAQSWSLKIYSDMGRLPAKACSVNPKRSTFYSKTSLNPGHTILCFDECPTSLPTCFFLQLLYS